MGLNPILIEYALASVRNGALAKQAALDGERNPITEGTREFTDAARPKVDIHRNRQWTPPEDPWEKKEAAKKQVPPQDDRERQGSPKAQARSKADIAANQAAAKPADPGRALIPHPNAHQGAQTPIKGDEWKQNFREGAPRPQEILEPGAARGPAKTVAPKMLGGPAGGGGGTIPPIGGGSLGGGAVPPPIPPAGGGGALVPIGAGAAGAGAGGRAFGNQALNWMYRNRYPLMGGAAALGLGAYGLSQMGGGTQPTAQPPAPKQETAKAAEYKGRRLDPNLVKIAKETLQKKAAPQLGGGGAAGSILGNAAGLAGAGAMLAPAVVSNSQMISDTYNAPKGHKLEGLRRGMTRGAGTGLGMGAGTLGGMQLQNLSNDPKTRLLLALGGGAGGMVLGGLGGHALGKAVNGKPSWEKASANFTGRIGDEMFDLKDMAQRNAFLGKGTDAAMSHNLSTRGMFRPGGFAALGALGGYMSSPSGHGIEGMGRGAVKGYGTGVGASGGARLGMQLGRLGSSGMSKALLASGGALAGGIGGGIAGNRLAAGMIGDPTWKKQSAATPLLGVDPATDVMSKDLTTRGLLKANPLMMAAGGLGGYMSAEKGHGLEGATRGVLKGYGAGVGATAGGRLGSQLGRLSSDSRLRAMLTGGGTIAGTLGGAALGVKGTGAMMGDPSWQKKSAGVVPPPRVPPLLAPPVQGLPNRMPGMPTNTNAAPPPPVARPPLQVPPKK